MASRAMIAARIAAGEAFFVDGARPDALPDWLSLSHGGSVHSADDAFGFSEGDSDMTFRSLARVFFYAEGPQWAILRSAPEL